MRDVAVSAGVIEYDEVGSGPPVVLLGAEHVSGVLAELGEQRIRESVHTLIAAVARVRSGLADAEAR